MSATAPSPDHDAPDWRAEHLAMLRELAELNMRLARAVVTQAEVAAAQQAEPDAPPAPHTADPSLALSRLGRAVRLTLAMEAKVRTEAQGEAAEPPSPRQPQAEASPLDPAGNRGPHITIKRWLVANALQEAAEEAEAGETGEAPDREDLFGDIVERLNGLSDDVLYDVPKSVLIDRLGAELGLAFETDTEEEARDLKLWRGWDLPPHDPGPPDEDAPQDQAFELSS